MVGIGDGCGFGRRQKTLVALSLLPLAIEVVEEKRRRRRSSPWMGAGLRLSKLQARTFLSDGETRRCYPWCSSSSMREDLRPLQCAVLHRSFTKWFVPGGGLDGRGGEALLRRRWSGARLLSSFLFEVPCAKCMGLVVFSFSCEVLD